LVGKFLAGKTNCHPYCFSKSAETVERTRVAGIFEAPRCEEKGPRVRKRLKTKALQGASNVFEKEKSAEVLEPRRVR
jgi:hypothetical protein